MLYISECPCLRLYGIKYKCSPVFSPYLFGLKQENMDHEHSFEGTEHEKLLLENELLKLKLQAELGAQFGSMPGVALPPEIEKQFLEQVMAFHKHIEDNPPVPMRNHLGNPDFKPSAELSEKALEEAWEALSFLLEEKQFRVDFLAEYPLALKYDFIIGELFDEETEVPVFEGQYICFIYEEFHPNHDYDIRRRTEEFMNGFFEGSFPETAGWYLAGEVITGDGQPLPREQLQPLLDRFHGVFSAIKEYGYSIEGTSAQPDDELKSNMPRLGFSEGVIRYTVVLNDGQEQEITGPFKLYLQQVYEWWQIFSFHVHGFSWT